MEENTREGRAPGRGASGWVSTGIERAPGWGNTRLERATGWRRAPGGGTTGEGSTSGAVLGEGPAGSVGLGRCQFCPWLPVPGGGVTVSPGWPRARQERGHPKELGPKAPTGHGALPGWPRPRASKAGAGGGQPQTWGDAVIWGLVLTPPAWRRASTSRGMCRIWLVSGVCPPRIPSEGSPLQAGGGLSTPAPPRE